MRGSTEPAIRARRGRAGALGSAALLLSAALGGCGLGGGTGSLGPTTTQVVVHGHLAVDPVEGPVGTVFTLSADGMVAGATVQFEITFPGEGRAYPGSALVVADDGTASASYRATAANQPGTYLVRLTGPQGELAGGEFRVTDGKSLASTSVPRSGSGSSTTARPGNAKTSTTKGGAVSTAPATTGKPATSVVRTMPTTVPPTTPPSTPPTTTTPTTA